MIMEQWKDDGKMTISVVITVYNDEQYLHRCLESILNQTFENLEIILINDGSSDNSGNICNEYKLRDSRVKVVHRSNEGTVAARRCGLACARGQLISFIDGDDWIEKDMYEHLIDVYNHSEYPDMISSGLIYEYPKSGIRSIALDGVPAKRYSKHEIRQSILPVLIYDPVAGQNSVLTSVCTKLIKKTVAQKAMEYMKTSLSLGEDGAYVYFLMANCGSLSIIHKAFYHYEQHEGSQNYKFDPNAFEKLIRLEHTMIEGMKKQVWSEEIRGQIEYFVLGYLGRLVEKNFHFRIRKYAYLFPFSKCERERNIIVYGAGIVGKSYIQNLRQTKYAKRILWADKNYVELRANGINVISIEEAIKEDFDYIVIAINDEIEANSMINNFLSRGITREKLIWVKPVRLNLYG